MAFQTKPSYTAATQSDISTEVPDTENGATAFAVLQQTSWQLSKTSAQPLGPNVIATKSGVGRWLRLRYAFSGRPTFEWNANGDLTLFSPDTNPPSGDGGNSFFDGARFVSESFFIVGFSMIQRSTGGSGNSVVEVYRYRASTFTLLATLTIASGPVLATNTQLAPASPLDELQPGDLVMCRFFSVQSASPTLVPQDVTVQMEVQ